MTTREGVFRFVLHKLDKDNSFEEFLFERMSTGLLYEHEDKHYPDPVDGEWDTMGSDLIKDIIEEELDQYEVDSVVEIYGKVFVQYQPEWMGSYTGEIPEPEIWTEQMQSQQLSKKRRDDWFVKAENERMRNDLNSEDKA